MTRFMPHRGDDGAVAVLVAILSVVLFGSAAVAVDLGKAFQRRRATQTTADLAALAGAQDLPRAQEACRSAIRYLRDNPPDGDGFSVTESMCTPAGDTPDGTVDVSASSTRIRVSVPRRNVDFGFAGVLGFSGTTVDAQATAEIQSPAPSIPYFLSNDTSVGLLCLKDTTSGRSGSASVMRAALLAAPPAPPTGSSTPTFTSVTPNPFTGPIGTEVVVKGTNLGVIVRVQFGGVDAVFSVNGSGRTLTATAPPGTGSVPVILHTRTDLTGTAYQLPDPFVFSLLPPPEPVVDDCAGSTGEFGHLDIPRSDNTNPAVQIELNIIRGVDHRIEIFPAALLPPTGEKCANSAGGAPVAGAVPDIGTGVPGANCVLTQTGNALPNSTRGFLDGLSGIDGRLKGQAPTGTVATRGDINIDTFASYLRSGATTADFIGPGAPGSIASLSTGSIDRSILDSPRFAVVPVLNVLSTGTTNGFYPVINLRGVFVDSVPSAPSHGFQTNGGSQVTAIRTFAFPLRLLPGTLSSGEVDHTIPYIGSGPAIPVLVE